MVSMGAEGKGSKSSRDAKVDMDTIVLQKVIWDAKVHMDAKVLQKVS